MDTTSTSAQKLTDELNKYTGDNIWQDVILRHLDVVAEDESIDASNDGTIVKLNDGSMIIYQPNLQQWFAYDAA
jgi:hypothetical protein